MALALRAGARAELDPVAVAAFVDRVRAVIASGAPKPAPSARPRP
jgi:hypothetical protein